MLLHHWKQQTGEEHKPSADVLRFLAPKTGSVRDGDDQGRLCFLGRLTMFSRFDLHSLAHAALPGPIWKSNAIEQLWRSWPWAVHATEVSGCAAW